TDERESGLLDGGAPFYRTYLTADGKYVAVGAIEPQFYAQLLDGLGLSADELPHQLDRDLFGEMQKLLAGGFATKTRDEWTQIFAGTDACVTPVLTWTEAAVGEHLKARATIVHENGFDQAAPAPRFSRSCAGPVEPTPSKATRIDEIGW